MIVLKAPQSPCSSDKKLYWEEGSIWCKPETFTFRNLCLPMGVRPHSFNRWDQRDVLLETSSCWSSISRYFSYKRVAFSFWDPFSWFKASNLLKNSNMLRDAPLPNFFRSSYIVFVICDANHRSREKVSNK